MANSVTGRTTLQIAGETRVLALDMNAADALYQLHGEHFALWLFKCFVGRPIKLEDGRKAREVEHLSPADLVGIVYALLATDREDRALRGEAVDESPAILRRSLTLAQFPDIQREVTRAVIASFGVPGEALEVVGGAASEPRGSRRAEMDGTGIAL